MNFKGKVKVIVLLVLMSVIIFSFNPIASYVINSDLSGRLIEKKSFQIYNSSNHISDILPTISLILHKYINEENAIESSISVNYDHYEAFENRSNDSLYLNLIYRDGLSYELSGILHNFTFSDFKNVKKYGFRYSGFKSDRFYIPTTHSLSSFPSDVLMVRPFIDLYINGQFTEFNFEVQKRIPGRILSSEAQPIEGVIALNRTEGEIYYIYISSIIFLLMTLTIAFTILSNKNGFSTNEELIAFASYIIAIEGFRDILGLSRLNGVCTLELLIILIPLITLCVVLIHSAYKIKKK